MPWKHRNIWYCIENINISTETTSTSNKTIEIGDIYKAKTQKTAQEKCQLQNDWLLWFALPFSTSKFNI